MPPSCRGLLLPTACLLLYAGPTQAQQAEGHNIEIVFDASGSMKTSTTRFTSFKDKVEIAKAELTRYIDHLPSSDVRLALRVFGTEQDLACQDIKLLRPLEALDKAKVKELIAPLAPATHGRTPIAKSLEMALDDFKGVDVAKGKNSIILLTDGLESCSGDVDKSIDKILKAGINLKVNIVGFDVLEADDSKVATELKDVAAKTGGKAEFPKTQAELEQSLKTLSPAEKPTSATPAAQADKGVLGLLAQNRVVVGVASLALLSMALMIVIRLRREPKEEDED